MVDDDRSALESLSEVLEREGYTVRRAIGGTQALQVISSENLDLVLTDLRMREVDGMKVLGAVRSGEKRSPSSS